MNIKTTQEGKQTKYFCPYCDQDMTPVDNTHRGWLDCDTCPVHIRYIIMGSFSSPIAAYIQFKSTDKYMLELNLLDDSTILSDQDKHAVIIRLNHVIDVNPNNCEAWIKRLIDLKAFT